MAPSGRNTGNSFLDSLSAENFDLLEHYFLKSTLKRDSVLCLPGSELDCVWFPLTAVLSVVTTLADGQDVEACTIGRESAYGLLNALGASRAIDRVIAQVPGDAIRVPSSRLKAAAALSVGMLDLIIRHAQANSAQTQQSVACNAVHSVEARLCRWLLMTQDRAQSSSLPLTQEFLGFMLGVQRTTVTRAAGTLQAAKLISYSRGRIEILNRAGLRAGACECYASVLDKQAQILGDCSPDVVHPHHSTGAEAASLRSAS
jgi:CRP-like cAMP-binding protein